MNKLDDLIAQKAYELDCLRSYRDIIKSGDCNNCKFLKDCNIKPKTGQMVRYNCYQYKWMFDNEEVNADGEN